MPHLRTIGRSVLALSGMGIMLLGMTVRGDQQPADRRTGPSAGTKPGEWRGINGGDSSTRFTPLSQIDASNVERLTVSWQWKGSESPVDLGGESLPRYLPIYAYF